MLKIDKRYKELLIKYASDDELVELLSLVRSDDFRERESFYLNNKQYPQQRDLLGKLAIDLATIKKALTTY